MNKINKINRNVKKSLDEGIFYKKVMEHARDMVLIINSDGSIINANLAAVNAYGYSIDEFMDMKIYDLRPPETRLDIDAQLKFAQKYGILFRTFHRKRNGETFPVEVSSQRIGIEEETIVVSIIRDITATVEIETAYQNKEAELREIYEELMAAHEELTATDEELRQQFDELLAKEEKINKQNFILQSLHETAIGLMNRHDLDDLLKRIIVGATEIVGTPHGFIYLLDQARKVFCRNYGIGIYEKDIGREIPYTQSSVGKVYNTGKPLVITDYHSWRQTSPEAPQFEEICSVLHIPLKSEGLVVGTIGLTYCESDKTFGKNEFDILSQFAELASIALDNAILVNSFKNELQERRKIEEALHISEAKHRAIFEAANDGICVLNMFTGRLLDANERACQLLGYSKAELPTKEIVFLGSDVVPIHSEIKQWLTRTANDGPQLFEWHYRRRDGTLNWVEINLKRAFIEKEDRILALVRDISERKIQEQAVRRMAYHDALTGLPNRIYIQEALGRELEKDDRGEARGAILFVDIDDLKIINDTLGHLYGDGVIIKAGAYLVAEAGEKAVVARIGGDEFIVLIPDEDDPKKIGLIAHNMLNLLNRDFEFEETRTHNISASIGIARYPSDGSSVIDLFKKADLALYAAKGSGKNTWRFYDPVLQNLAYEKMILKRGLSKAIERKELFLHYQPIVSAVSGAVISFEALLRWKSAEHGMVSPYRFIPIAEENNTIRKIGKWVITEACNFAKKLEKMGRGDIRVSINVSPRQLLADEIVPFIYESILAADINPNQLEFEITESVLMSSIEDSTQKLNALRDIGVSISLDDFGTGYSSLTYLRNLPVETIKIDKSFIQRIAEDDTQLRFVRLIIDMAHILGLTVIAEGVETSNQLQKLLECQCEFVQGYLLGHPTDEETAIAYLANQKFQYKCY